MQSISSEEVVQARDFTTVLDERKTPQTVGFIAELSGQLCTFNRLTKGKAPKNQSMAQQNTMQSGETRLPMIRVVEPGTFMEYRRLRGEKMKIGLGQIKVPVLTPYPKNGYWRG